MHSLSAHWQLMPQEAQPFIIDSHCKESLVMLKKIHPLPHTHTVSHIF